MTALAAPLRSPDGSSYRPRPNYRPGDLVTPTAGYPILYEVLAIEREGALRVRGLNWSPGYSAMVTTGDVRPVTSILHD
jgi:hypothetical protein